MWLEKNSSFVQTGVDVEDKNVVQREARWPLKLTVANLNCMLLEGGGIRNTQRKPTQSRREPHGYAVSSERYTEIQIYVFYFKQTANSFEREWT